MIIKGVCVHLPRPLILFTRYITIGITDFLCAYTT